MAPTVAGLISTGEAAVIEVVIAMLGSLAIGEIVDRMKSLSSC